MPRHADGAAALGEELQRSGMHRRGLAREYRRRGLAGSPRPSDSSTTKTLRSPRRGSSHRALTGIKVAWRLGAVQQAHRHEHARVAGRRAVARHVDLRDGGEAGGLEKRRDARDARLRADRARGPAVRRSRPGCLLDLLEHAPGSAGPRRSGRRSPRPGTGRRAGFDDHPDLDVALADAPATGARTIVLASAERLSWRSPAPARRAPRPGRRASAASSCASRVSSSSGLMRPSRASTRSRTT